MCYLNLQANSDSVPCKRLFWSSDYSLGFVNKSSWNILFLNVFTSYNDVLWYSRTILLWPLTCVSASVVVLGTTIDLACIPYIVSSRTYCRAQVSSYLACTCHNACMLAKSPCYFSYQPSSNWPTHPSAFGLRQPTCFPLSQHSTASMKS